MLVRMLGGDNSWVVGCGKPIHQWIFSTCRCLLVSQVLSFPVLSVNGQAYAFPLPFHRLTIHNRRRKGYPVVGAGKLWDTDDSWEVDSCGKRDATGNHFLHLLSFSTVPQPRILWLGTEREGMRRAYARWRRREKNSETSIRLHYEFSTIKPATVWFIVGLVNGGTWRRRGLSASQLIFPWAGS